MQDEYDFSKKIVVVQPIPINESQKKKKLSNMNILSFYLRKNGDKVRKKYQKVSSFSARRKSIDNF